MNEENKDLTKPVSGSGYREAMTSLNEPCALAGDAPAGTLALDAPAESFNEARARGGEKNGDNERGPVKVKSRRSASFVGGHGHGQILADVPKYIYRKRNVAASSLENLKQSRKRAGIKGTRGPLKKPVIEVLREELPERELISIIKKLAHHNPQLAKDLLDRYAGKAGEGDRVLIVKVIDYSKAKIQ